MNNKSPVVQITDEMELRWFKVALEQIESISQKHAIADEILGRKFNIFQLIRNGYEEVAVHSRFLGVLLDPQGRHGMGSTFLELFLNDVVNRVPGKIINSKSSFQVFLERDFGDGRIDICIESSISKVCIVIENKIYAGDQDAQIERYTNYTKLKSPESDKRLVLYLTLYGGEPSSSSLGKVTTEEYACISYKEDILQWLEHCLHLSMQKPFIRENINQYIDLIKQFTGISGVNMTNDIKEYILHKINSKALKQLSVLQKTVDKIQDERAQEFYNRVCKMLSQIPGYELQKHMSSPFTCSAVRSVGQYKELQRFSLRPINSKPYCIRAGFWLEKANAYENGIGNGFCCIISVAKEANEMLKNTLIKILSENHVEIQVVNYKNPLEFKLQIPEPKLDLLREFDWIDPSILERMASEVCNMILKYSKLLLQASEECNQ